MSRLSKIAFGVLIFSLTFVVTQGSLAAGFSKGNDFQVRPLSGQANVACYEDNYPYGGQTYRFEVVNCRADEWSPGITDYFAGPAGVQADRVRLTSVRADGSTESRETGYDSQAGLSSKKFNLGIRTLTQKPLLKSGRNNISYQLSQNGSTVSEGQFTAQVTVQPEARCPYATVSSGMNCAAAYSACDEYFNRVAPDCR